MGSATTFLINACISLLVSVLVALVLWRSLKNILADLTGTKERAAFWTVFSSIMLVLVPQVSGMFAYSGFTVGEDLFASIIRQLRWSLIGLVSTLAVIGVVMIWFVQSLNIEERRPELRRK